MAGGVILDHPFADTHRAAPALTATHSVLQDSPDEDCQRREPGWRRLLSRVGATTSDMHAAVFHVVCQFLLTVQHTWWTIVLFCVCS